MCVCVCLIPYQKGEGSQTWKIFKCNIQIKCEHVVICSPLEILKFIYLSFECKIPSVSELWLIKGF